MYLVQKEDIFSQTESKSISLP